MHHKSKPAFPYADADYARMERRLDKSGECWLYIGQPSQERPFFKRWWNGRKCIGAVMAYVAAYELYVGPIPDGLWVLHHCDVPRCCRPDHLWLGTPQDNSSDMRAKGRSRGGAKNPLRGEAVPTSKLTESAVRAIRRDYAAGGVTQWDLARRYGVYQGIISSVILRRTWRHVQ